MNATQTDLDALHDIPRVKSEIPYVRAWRNRYPHIPNPIFVDDVKPVNCALAHICLAHIQRHPEAYRGKDGALKFTLFLMPYNPSSKIDRSLQNRVECWNGQRVIPFGDVYHIQFLALCRFYLKNWGGAYFATPIIKDGCWWYCDE